MTASLSLLATVRTPLAVADATQRHLRASGRQGLEGMALWAGHVDGDQFRVSEVIVPQQQGHRTEHGLAVSVPGDELHRINIYLHRQGLRLIAQIHSHPTEAYHSDTDDRYAIATALGSLSIVVPDFAVRPFALNDCAVFRLSKRPWWHGSKSAWWRELPPAELTRTLMLEG